jgi:hypothetical protein
VNVKNNRRLVLLLALVPLFIACSICVYGFYLESKPKGCTPPSNFSRSDLIGTWRYEINGVSDTITIRDDGRYKQIIHIQTPAFNFESDWQPWKVDYKNKNIPYLHLEGMRLCVYWEGMDCTQPGGGDFKWLDYCTNEWINMPNQGIMIVLSSVHSPRKMQLVSLQKSSEGITVYEFIRP